MKTKNYLQLKSWLLMMLMLIGVGNAAWAEKITNYTNIVSGTQYYIGATSGTTDYYLSVDGTSISASIAGTAVTSKANATSFTFTGSDTSWTIQFDSGYYLSLKNGKDNGKVQVVEDAATFTASNQNGKLRLTIGSYSIQKNNSGTQFGSYGNTQTDIWLEAASSEYTITAKSNNDSYGTVSLSGSIITGSPASGYQYADPAYTVSPANSATVTQEGNAFTVTPSENTTVTINFEAIPTYTVTLGDDNSTLTETTGGAGVTLPTRSAIGAYTFAGWVTTNIAAETTTAPNTIIPSGAYAPTANITLYPVYTKAGGGAAAPSPFSVGDTGDYAIVSAEQNGKYYALPTNPSVSSGKITAQEISVSEIDDVKFVTTANANGFTWTIATATNGYTLSDGSNYIYHSNGGASGTNVAYGTSTSYTWAFTSDGDYVTMAGMSGSTTNNRGLLFSGTTIGGYALSNANSSGYYKVMILPISAGATTYYWSSPVVAAVEQPVITVGANPFLFSTTATITCATEDAPIKYSFDGETWNDYSEALTITDTKTIYAKAIKGENESAVAQVTATKNLATPSVTISGDLTLDLDGETNVNAGTLTAAVTYNDAAVDGATVTWSSSNDAVATIDASGAVTIKKTGEVTFTATYAGNSDYAEATVTKAITITDSKAPGSEAKPYTVVQALAATVANGVYVKGIVSAVTEVSTQYGNVTYKISDDGTTDSNQFIVFRGKNIGNEAITSEEDVQVGDVVIVYGNIAEYQGTNQLAQGNYIISLTRPEKPKHIVSWSINGIILSTSEVEEGKAITFPEAPADIFGKTFVGWTTAAIDGETDTKPELVSSAIMGTADQKFYAVFAIQEGEDTEITDVITTDVTGGTKSYSDWSSKTVNSSAVYAGNSAVNEGTIQLRSKDNNSGIITTATGGQLKKVVVDWDNATADTRTLNIYGSATAYSAATDLYNSSKQGTLLGTIVNGTSTELTIEGNYEYVGLRSNSGAMYLNSISITWEGGTPATYSAYCTTVIAPVAQIGDVKYGSLADAVAAVPTDGTETTITMIADETIVGNTGVTIPTTKNVKLDLNGKLVKLVVAENKASQLIQNNGTLTIVDSSEEQTGELTHELAEGVQAGDWNATPQRNWATNVITNCGTLNLEGGTLRAGNMTGSIIYAVDNNSTSFDATFNMNGGIVTGIGTLVRQFCNSKTKENVVNVSGGKIESSGYTAIWTQVVSKDNKATLNITGGEVKGGTYAWYDTGSKESTSVNYSISGGKLTGDIFSYAQYYGAIDGFITGGLFSEDVSSCCAEGLTCVANTDEATKDDYPYAVGEAEIIYSWVENGTEYKEYHLFATPFVKGYIMNGESITLLQNVTLTENIACQLAEGAFTLTFGEYNVTKGDYSVSLKPNVSVLTDKQTDIFSAAEEGYAIIETKTDEGYSYTAEKVEVVAPIVFHDSGTYEGSLKLTMMAENGVIKYTVNGGDEQTYSAPFEITESVNEDGDLYVVWAELNGVKSGVVERTYKITPAMTGSTVTEGYYNIQTNKGKYVNVAGRKTVTLVDDVEGMPGTVIRVKTNEKGQLEVLRSQAVDLPSYAEKATGYVSELVKELVKRLGSTSIENNDIIGELGTDLIVNKFNQEFDYHLYLEQVGNGYRIFGRTPSMKPVVDFYAENKELVDSRLPRVEEFVEEVLVKITDKIGKGQSWTDKFKILTVWENMGGEESGLTKPETDNAEAISKFYEEVLTSEANIWNFAYQAAMIYWPRVKSYLSENASELGDYSKYIDRVENIQPNFRYYIVPSESGLDLISQGNIAIETKDESAIWKMTPCDKFVAKMNVVSEKNIYTTTANETKSYTEYYTTLYTDFAYTLPEGVKAFKINGINTKYNTVLKEEIKSTIIPAQTPVLLFAQSESVELIPEKNDGSVLSENELYGNDWLINKYPLNTPQLETIFALLTKLSSSLGEKYEHLKRLNAGTVNNKYFFNLAVPTEEGDFKEDFNNGKIKVLSNGENGIGFYSNYDKNLVGNEAFMFSEGYNPIMLSLIGDVNRDGDISIADVTALVNIILGKAKYPDDLDKYDFDAANVNQDTQISIADVTKLVNIILGKK